MDYKNLLDSLLKPRSFSDKLKDGASMDCGLAGAMPLREYPLLGRKTIRPTRTPEDDNDDDYS